MAPLRAEIEYHESSDENDIGDGYVPPIIGTQPGLKPAPLRDMVSLLAPLNLASSSRVESTSRLHRNRARYMPPIGGEVTATFGGDLDSAASGSDSSYAKFADQISRLTSMSMTMSGSDLAESSNIDLRQHESRMLPLPPPADASLRRRARA